MAFPDSDSDGDIAVAVQGATITYGDFTAVNNVSVDFPRGKFTCIIGPNGHYWSQWLWQIHPSARYGASIAHRGRHYFLRKQRD